MYQIPHILHALGAQPTRYLMASLDILLATFTANAVVLASLRQDRGYKKSKFKQTSLKDRKSSLLTARSHVSVVGGAGRKSRWGSDEDLIIDGDKKDVLIRMKVLKGERLSESGVEIPGKAKLQEIRVARVRGRCMLIGGVGRRMIFLESCGLDFGL
jgi:hypothetical protein